MSIITKIQEGTARSDTDLCATCRYCFRMTTGEGIETRNCRSNFYTPIQLTSRVVRCSSYSDSRLTSLEAMQDIAWELIPPANRGKVGFITPEERRKAGIAPSSLPRF